MVIDVSTLLSMNREAGYSCVFSVVLYIPPCFAYPLIWGQTLGAVVKNDTWCACV